MPIYEYENERGGRVELYRPVARRDDAPPGCRRVIVPSRAASFCSGRPDPGDADEASPRGIRDLEARHGSDFIHRELGFTHRQLRKTWDFKSSYTT